MIEAWTIVTEWLAQTMVLLWNMLLGFSSVGGIVIVSLLAKRVVRMIARLIHR